MKLGLSILALSIITHVQKSEGKGKDQLKIKHECVMYIHLTQKNTIALKADFINVIGYTQEQSSFCELVLASYSSLAEANAACDLDEKCGGFYDVCGKGDSFKICGPTFIKQSSGCGAILYAKPNYQAGEIFIQFSDGHINTNINCYLNICHQYSQLFMNIDTTYI